MALNQDQATTLIGMLTDTVASLQVTVAQLQQENQRLREGGETQRIDVQVPDDAHELQPQ